MFFPFIFLQKVTFTSERILFSSQHAPFLSSWNILLLFVNYCSTGSLIWLSFLLRFSLNAFLQFLKISHMHFINKNVPAKWDETFIWGKSSHQSEIPVFWTVGGIIYFHITDFDFSIELFHKVRSRLTEPLT